MHEINEQNTTYDMPAWRGKESNSDQDYFIFFLEKEKMLTACDTKSTSSGKFSSAQII